MTSIIRAGHGVRRRRQAIDRLRLVASEHVCGVTVEQYDPTSVDPLGRPLFLVNGKPVSTLRSMDEAVEIIRKCLMSLQTHKQQKSLIPQWADSRKGARGAVTVIKMQNGKQYFRAEFAESTLDLKGALAEVFRPGTDTNACPQFLGLTSVKRVWRGNLLDCASIVFCVKKGDFVLVPSDEQRRLDQLERAIAPIKLLEGQPGVSFALLEALLGVCIVTV